MTKAKYEVCPYVLTTTEIIVNVSDKEDGRIVYSARRGYTQNILVDKFKELIDSATNEALEWAWPTKQ